LRGLARLQGEHESRHFSLLDVGTGSGDIPVRLVRWAEDRQLSTQIIALEYQAVSIAQAALQTHGSDGIFLIRGDGATPPFRPASVDYVLASQFLNHFSEEAIIALLRSWAGLARRAIIISDLVRHPFAYYGIRLLTRLCTRNVMTRVDAPLSVTRAFTMGEWREIFQRADIGAFDVRWAFPFRMLAIGSLGK